MTDPTLPDPAARFDLRGRSLRQHAARGSLVNTAFVVSLSFLAFLRGFVLAAFLTREDYGVWGLVVIAMGVVVGLRSIGIGDKYIQQDEGDQERAFQKAFTLELGVGVAATLLAMATLPVFILATGEEALLLPGLLVSLNFLATPLQMPLFFHYRRMEFLRQRILQSIDPVVAFVVSIALAVAGAGYWALFAGVSAGAWSAALIAALRSPYPLRVRYDRGTLRDYWSFSAPLLVANAGGLVVAVGAMLVTTWEVGLAGAGALTLAATISQFTDRVDELVTGTLYPAIASVRDRMDVLYETFVKSNRLALMWAMPFGIGVSLFCADLVRFAIGEKWAPAVPLLQVFGVTAAIGHLGFNWHAYFRARAETRPMAVASVAAAAAFLGAGVPLIVAYGLPGLAAGVAIQLAAHLACRAYYLARLFDGFAFLPHAGRAVLPSVPAVALVLAARVAESGPRTHAMVVAEAVGYLLVTLAATLALEGRLLREVVGYLRARPT